MFSPIVECPDPITLVGGGEATVTDLHKALTLAPICVAVDGGAALAINAGVDVEAVIGDFDSLSEAMRAKIPVHQQHHVTEQTHTDFEKALLRVAAPALLCVGFTGGRMDHQLATLHALVAFAHQPCIVLAGQELIFLAPPSISLPTVPGEVVSLFPLAVVAGRSDGLHWPIDGLTLAPGQRVGTSNRALGPIRVEVDAPGMLMIVPQRLLAEVTRLFAAPERAQWPVPAR